jgi:hypothetical protein
LLGNPVWPLPFSAYRYSRPEESTVYEQSGGAGCADDEGTTEDIRMFQDAGRSEDILPDTRLYFHLPETGDDGQWAVKLIFQGKLPDFVPFSDIPAE